MKGFFAIVLVSALALASATCPNLCNGHGTCEANDRCVCFSNWQGADCSERVCSFGLAWVDAPGATNEAHWYAECSNKGICDRATGLCDCFPGYEGKGCRRSTCPNDCSGHGTCYFIDQLEADDTEPTQRRVRVDYGTRENNHLDKTWYDLWDKSKIQGCVCDPYYEGADCSLRMCPRGDNVLTVGSSTSGVIDAKDQGNTVHEIFIGQPTVTAVFTGEFTLTFKDLYGGAWETDPIQISDFSGNYFSQSDIAGRIKDELENLPNDVIESVTVTSVPCGTGLTTTAGSACTDDASVTSTNMCLATSAVDVPNGRLGGGYLGYNSATMTAIGAEGEDPDATVGAVAGDYGVNYPCLDFTVEFTGHQNVGVQNILEVNYKGCDYDGCAPRYRGITDSDVDGTAAEALIVLVRDVTADVPTSALNKRMHKEREVCSEHGLCDSTTGLCTCFSGYYDEDCSKQTVLI